MKRGLALVLLTIGGCQGNLSVGTGAYYNSTSAVAMRASDNSILAAIRPNSSLTCVLDRDEIDATNITYSWIGVSEQNTTNSYTVSEDDAGNAISCQITYFDSQGFLIREFQIHLQLFLMFPNYVSIQVRKNSLLV